MSLGIYNSAAFTTASGVAVAPNADVEVRRESDSALASIYSDRAGATPIAQPGFQADTTGRFVFYVAGLSGGYQVKVTKGAETYTLRNVAIGTAQELDADPFWAGPLATASEAAARAALGVPSNASAVRKNAIINGALNIWQRGTSFAAAANGTYTADRWFYITVGATAVHTLSRSSDAPGVVNESGTGFPFNYSLLADCTTADAAVAAGDLVGVSHKVEGYNFRRLQGRPFVVSFWVKATKTGIYCAAFGNSGADRSFVAEYTVNVAATWEYKTVTVLASPSAGTWDYTTGVGLQATFTLMAGSTYQTTAGAWQTGGFYATANQVNACDNAANNFQIVGVQIEPGDVATEFEHRSVQDDLKLCQRYYWKTFAQATAPAQAAGVGVGTWTLVVPAAGNAAVGVRFPMTMRATPTITSYNPVSAANTWRDTTNNADRALTGPSGLGDGGFWIGITGHTAGAVNEIHLTAAAEL